MIALLSFLLNVFFTFIWEYIKYVFSGDYKLFIRNIAKSLAKENILYVKIFQAISLNNYSISDEINNELLQFTDNSPYNEDDINYELIQKIVYENNLTGNVAKPINSGMISLVYKMRDSENNCNIILKVKRNNIEEKLNNSIKELLFCLKVLSFFSIPILNTFDINKTINKNIDVIHQQLNFHQEVENMKLMKENCKHMPHIVIPHVYEKITQKYNDAIMMEYIQGETILNVPKEDYDVYSKLITKFGFACLLNHGFSHGDLHGGNILFIKENIDNKPVYKLGIIDFGIMIKIDNDFKNSILNIAFNLFDAPAKETANKLFLTCIEPKEMIKLLKEEHYENIVGMITKGIEGIIFKSEKINQTILYTSLNDFNSYLTKNDLTKYGLYLNDNFVKLQVALAMCQGVTLHLSKDKYIDIMSDALKEMFHSEIFEDND
jgi:predicted unusual protein kinase regulating ubiquinone biosynthesis (AarF/ABC1/UbiB family)